MKLSAILIVILFLVGCQTSIVPEQAKGISVSGKAERATGPDRGNVHLAIETLAQTARETQDINIEDSNRVMEVLRPLGTVETEGYTIQEEREWDPKTNKMVFRGYRASHRIKVSSDVDKVGAIADISVKNGANRIDNIEFTLSREKTELVREELLREAAEDARNKAKILADAMGVRLGKLNSVSEAYYDIIPYRTVSMSSESVPEIAPEKVRTSVSINAVFGVI